MIVVVTEGEKDAIAVRDEHLATPHASYLGGSGKAGDADYRDLSGNGGRGVGRRRRQGASRPTAWVDPELPGRQERRAIYLVPHQGSERPDEGAADVPARSRLADVT